MFEIKNFQALLFCNLMNTLKMRENIKSISNSLIHNYFTFVGISNILEMKKSEYQLQIIFKIKQEREARGLGQKNIANILGISEGHVGNIESPKFPQKYTLKQLDTLCKYFKMPTEQLFITDDIYVQEDINITTLLVEKIVEYEN